MSGWLVNDYISCIPNTRTLWTDLLDFLPDLTDCTGYGYDILADKTEELAKQGLPDYIIRNSSYFRRLNINRPTISFVQDPHRDAQQIDVCNHSTTVICSEWIRDLFGGLLTGRVEIIPTGVDFDFFKSRHHEYIGAEYAGKMADYYADMHGLLDCSILFLGANQYNKGFDHLLKLITETDYNFTCIFKDDTKINHPRVKCFNRIPSQTVYEIMCGCLVFLCLSRTEPQHVSGVEAGAVGLPIVANNVGWYYDRNYDKTGGMTETQWGVVVHNDDYKAGIDLVMKEPWKYDSTTFLKENGYDRPEYKQKWVDLVNELTHDT